MNIPNNRVLIELHVPDFDKVKEFYGQLGFEVVWQRPPEEHKGYLVIRKDDNILCFWPGNEKLTDQSYFKRFPEGTSRGYGVELVIIVNDLDACYEVAKKTGRVVEALETKPWGLKDFRVEDPFGYYLRFTEPHNILDDSNAVK